MSKIHTRCEEVLRWMGANSSDTFLPGLSNEEIYCLTKDTVLHLSAEITALYTWRNGQSYEDEEGLNIPFGIYVFLPLDRAISEGASLAELDGNWSKSWLPILSDDAGAYYFCDCTRSNTISQVFRYFPEADEIRCLKFESIEELLIGIVADSK